MSTPIINIKDKLSIDIKIVNDGKWIVNCLEYNTMTRQATVSGKEIIYKKEKFFGPSFILNESEGTTTYYLPNSHIEFFHT